MNQNSQSHAIYYLIRQLTCLVKKGESIDTALDKLKNTIPNKYYGSLEMVSNLFADQPDPTKLESRAGPIARLYKLLNIIKRNQADATKFLGRFHDVFLNTPSGVMFKTYDIGSLLFYVLSLFTVLFIIVTINTIFVLPQFQDMFNMFGSDLPMLTRMVIYTSDNLGWLMIIFAAGLAFGFWYLIYISNSNTRTLQYFTSRMYKFPGLNIIAKHYNYYLIMNYISMLVEAGVDKETAINEIQAEIPDFSLVNSKQLFLNPDDTSVALTSSYQLDTFESELDYQIQNTQEKSAIDFVKFKDRLSLISLISVAIVIGLFVIALYLPLFQLGKVVA